MKQRIHVGTDIATIGAWDANCNQSPVAKRWGKVWDQTLKEDAAKGDIFLIYTGADMGGSIDIYLDTEVPAEVKAASRPPDRDFLISVPTGRLVVGGAEDYRSDKPGITAENSVVQIPPGNYSLRCYIGNPGSEETGENPGESTIPPEDYAYFQKIQKRTLLGCLTPLLFPVLAWFVGWKIALPVTVVVFFSYFPIRERLLRRNTRYQQVLKALDEAEQRAQETAPPDFVLELRPLKGVADLKGGSVRV